MTIPQFVAASSLYVTRSAYAAKAMVRQEPSLKQFILQAGCDIVRPGGGGAGTGGHHHQQPSRCGPNGRCCEPAPNGLCFLCIPRNAQCP
jgi:hypothetical protein